MDKFIRIFDGSGTAVRMLQVCNREGSRFCSVVCFAVIHWLTYAVFLVLLKLPIRRNLRPAVMACSQINPPSPCCAPRFTPEHAADLLPVAPFFRAFILSQRNVVDNGASSQATKPELFPTVNKKCNWGFLCQGHTGGVISFSWTAGGQLISGSWDGTAKVWDVASGACLATLEGHENGVCVLGLPNGTVATGSTGKQSGNGVMGFQIRLWGADGHQMRSLTEHHGPVRSLDLVPGVGFLSTSNDGSARLWSLEGEPLAVMPHQATREGQPAFVLSGCALPGGVETVSVDESGGCMIWRGSEPAQSIVHPGGLWAVAALPASGDFVTACQDSTLRVFTRSGERAAAAEAVAAFEKAVADATAAAARGPSDVEIAKLPDWEGARHGMRGNSEGQVQMFQRAGKAIAAQWSSASFMWIEIGEVMGSSTAGTVDGVTYDHVFPIEIEAASGEVQKLEIGYNNGDNPFTTAQAFVDRHQMPQSYLGQIADYITQRAGRPAPVLGGPLGSGGGGGGGFSGVGDPTGFTSGAGLGGGGGSFGSAKAKPFASVPFCLLDSGANLEKIAAKILELSGGVTDPALRLTDGDRAALASLAATLAATNRYHASQVQRAELVLACKLVSWPVEAVFPCLDLCRILLLHPHAAELLAREESLGTSLMASAAARCAEAVGSTVQVSPGMEGFGFLSFWICVVLLFAGRCWTFRRTTAVFVWLSAGCGTRQSIRQPVSLQLLLSVSSVIVSASPPKIQMQVALCSIRLFANALKPRALRALVLPCLTGILDAVSDQASTEKKAVRAALASLLCNVAVALRGDDVAAAGGGAAAFTPQAARDAAQQLVALCYEVLSNAGAVADRPALEDDALLRTLQAVGVLASAGDRGDGGTAAEAGAAAKTAARDIGMAGVVQTVAMGRAVIVQTCAKEVESVL
ncbi:unnamed protein product [Phaeothamnion confervicola]